MNRTAELLYSPGSPFVRKVRVAAAELDITLKLTEVAANPLKDNASILAVNPLGKIPALITPGGDCLYDSAVICRWLGEATALYPKGQAGWRALRREALADGLMEAALLMRYEDLLRPEPLRAQGWIEAQKGKILHALLAMERDVQPIKSPDIGDLATGCALGYLDFRYPDMAWRSRHPKLTSWASQLLMRPAFLGTSSE